MNGLAIMALAELWRVLFSEQYAAFIHVGHRHPFVKDIIAET